MNCSECREAISAWLDGLLDEPARAAFESHVASCAACRAEVDGAARVCARLAAASAAGRTVRARVMHTISGRAIRPRRMDMVRKHMRGFIAAAAAAAVVLVGMFWWMTSGPKAPMSAWASLSDAVENSKAAEWVHYRSDIQMGGQSIEGWASMQPYRVATKSGDLLIFVDGAKRKQYVYDLAAQTITVDDILQSDMPSNQASDYFGAVTANLKEMEAKGFAVTREQKTVDGKAYEVYKCDLGTAGMTMMIAVDPAERRVASIEMGGMVGAGHMVFNYPGTGPEDIYALGAPKEASVVEGSLAKVRALADRIAAARKAFAPQYFAILRSVTASQDSTPLSNSVTVVYKKGDRYRIEIYGASGARAGRAVPPDDMAALEEWLKGQTMTNAFLADASLEADRTAPKPGATWFWFDKDGQVTRKTPSLYMWQMYTVEGWTWTMGPLVIMAGMPGITLLPPTKGEYGELEGIGTFCGSVSIHGKNKMLESMGRMSGQFFNPARDYAMERAVNVQFAKEVTHADAETAILAIESTSPLAKSVEISKVAEYGQTPAGRWYARVATRPTWGPGEGDKTETTTVFLDTTREIPDDIFDLAKFEAEHKPSAK